MVRQLKQTETKQEESGGLVRAFFRGFFWPLRMVFIGLAWISHRPPLKQIGHRLRWLFRTRVMRFIGRLVGFSFVRSSWKELKQVTWPSLKEGRRLTTAVIIFSVVFGALIAAVDYGLDKLFRQLLLK